TEKDHCSRLHDRELDIEPGPARRDVLRPRLLVNPPLPARLPVEVLHDIGHVDVVSIDSRRFERAVENPAGRPDERPSDLILLIAWLFADEHQARTLRTFPKDGLCALLPQLARVAIFSGFADGGQRRTRWDQFGCRLACRRLAGTTRRHRSPAVVA